MNTCILFCTFVILEAQYLGVNQFYDSECTANVEMSSAALPMNDCLILSTIPPWAVPLPTDSPYRSDKTFFSIDENSVRTKNYDDDDVFNFVTFFYSDSNCLSPIGNISINLYTALCYQVLNLISQYQANS